MSHTTIEALHLTKDQLFNLGLLAFIGLCSPRIGFFMLFVSIIIAYVDMSNGDLRLPG